MSTNAQPLRLQIPIVIQVPVDESAASSAELVRELRTIADEIRGYTERIEAAISGEALFYTDEEVAQMFVISQKSAAELRREGKLRFKNVKGRKVTTRRFLEEFLSK